MTAKLSAFDLIRQDWHQRRKWMLTERGYNVILAVAANDQRKP
jgi:hypothetical protein